MKNLLLDESEIREVTVGGEKIIVIVNKNTKEEKKPRKERICKALNLGKDTKTE